MHHRLSRKLSGGSNFISSHYTSTGYALTDVDMVIVVLVATLVYAIFRGCLYLYS